MLIFQNPVIENYAVIWTVFQPLLFGLIGNEIDFDLLDLRNVGLGAGCLAVSLTVSIVFLRQHFIIFLAAAIAQLV